MSAPSIVVLGAFAELVERGRALFPERLDAAGVLVRLTVDVGKLARYVRGATKDRKKCPACLGFGKLRNDSADTDEECLSCLGSGRSNQMEIDLRLVMGNLLFSMIRWCDDLGLDPAECVALAEEQQRKFAGENEER